MVFIEDLYDNDHAMGGADEDDDDDEEYVRQAMLEREQAPPEPIAMTMVIRTRTRVPDSPNNAVNLPQSALSALYADQLAGQPAAAGRAMDPQGRPFRTACFDSELINHPHHHRLRCGHDIITTEIEVCGTNCQPSADHRAALAFKDAFACSAAKCNPKQKASVFIPTSRQKRRMRRRVCRLSQVRGVDQMAADERTKEALKPKQTRKHPKPAAQSSEDEIPQALHNTRQNADKIDAAEELNALIASDPTYKSLLDFTGPGVLAKSNGKFMTRQEWTAQFGQTKLSKALFELQVENKEFLSEKVQEEMKRAKAEGGNDDGDTQGVFLNGVCNNCMQPLYDIRFTCVECHDVDFCNMFRRHSHDSTHHLEIYMVPIMSAEVVAEAGGDKTGEKEKSTPASTRETRSARRKTDRNGRSGILSNRDRVDTGRIRKAKAQIEDEKRIHKPATRAQQTRELRAAGSEAEKEAIKAKYQAILDDEDREDIEIEHTEEEKMVRELFKGPEQGLQ